MVRQHSHSIYVMAEKLYDELSMKILFFLASYLVLPSKSGLLPLFKACTRKIIVCIVEMQDSLSFAKPFYHCGLIPSRRVSD